MSLSWIQTNSSNILPEIRQVNIIYNLLGLFFWGESCVYLETSILIIIYYLNVNLYLNDSPRMEYKDW